MDQRVDRWIDEHEKQLIESLQKCLSYRTVKDSAAAKPGAPFGPAIADCLENALAQAQALGFETKNLDGYCGCVDFSMRVPASPSLRRSETMWTSTDRSVT